MLRLEIERGKIIGTFPVKNKQGIVCGFKRFVGREILVVLLPEEKIKQVA